MSWPKRGALLCLRCRDTGHIAADCPGTKAAQPDSITQVLSVNGLSRGNDSHMCSPPPTSPSPPRSSLLASTYWIRLLKSRRHSNNIVNHIQDDKQQRGKLCARCRTIKLDWTDNENNKRWNARQQRDRQVANLGPAWRVKFWEVCPLCVLLFEITPDPSSEENPEEMKNGGKLKEEKKESWKLDIVIIMTFALGRLGRSPHIPFILEQDDLSWAECLYTAIHDYSKGYTICMDVGNSICPIEADGEKERKILGARVVPSEGVDVGLLKSWLERCDRHHDERCKPELSEKLRRIRLIDVESRKLVEYPHTDACDERCQYVALSYVWGSATPRSYDVGDVLNGRLAPTVEDAIRATRQLGKRYLWVEAICIKQQDTTHKTGQIAVMDSIYSGAWVTIVALSRSDADFGLCRVSGNLDSTMRYHTSDEIYHRRRCRQLERSIRGKTWATVLPTLDQQLRKSRWRYRAWTLQEAVLSPRCLYFSCEQVYFQCNSVQCCESLADEYNPIFPIKGASQMGKMISSGGTASSSLFSIMDDYPDGSYISPFAVPDEEDKECQGEDLALFRQLVMYDRLLEQYSRREFSFDSDAINAFSAILGRLQIKCGSKAFWGLLEAALPWTMMWEEKSYASSRRVGFPSWSWASWNGPLGSGQDPMEKPGTINTADTPEPFLNIWKIEGGQLVNLFALSDPKNYEIRCWDYILSDLSRPPPRTDGFDQGRFPDAEAKGYLLIDGIILRLPLNWKPPYYDRHGMPRYESYPHMDVQYGNIKNRRLAPEESELGRLKYMVGKQQDFLIVFGRDIADHPASKHSALFLSLILLRWEDNVAYRVAVMHIRIEGYARDAILQANPQRRRFMLG